MPPRQARRLQRGSACAPPQTRAQHHCVSDVEAPVTYYLVLKFLHVIGATVLLGTGAGIAFFMLLAHRSGNPTVIAGVLRIVVIADVLFTASAVIAQPITGVLLAWQAGYVLSEGWIAASMALYLLTGAFWLPV